MTIETFRESTEAEAPPDGLSVPLEAMWYQEKGNWDEAHRLAQSENSPNGSWVHAYLHRVEGDLGNAAYWYGLADKPVCTSSLDDEWEEIVTALI
jgi:hypothetical protein